MALKLLNIGLRHLLTQLHHLLVHLAVLRLNLHDLFETAIRLHLLPYIKLILLSSISAFPFRCKAFVYVLLIPRALSQSSRHFWNSKS